MIFTKRSVCFKFENVITHPITSYIKNKFNIIETHELDDNIRKQIDKYYKNKFNIYIYTFKNSEQDIKKMHNTLNNNNIPFLGIINASNISCHEDFLYTLMKMKITKLYTDAVSFKDVDTKSFNIDLNLIERPYNVNVLKMDLWLKEKRRI